MFIFYLIIFNFIKFKGIKIPFEDLKDFVKLTEKLLIEHPEMADMRGEIKKSKLWLAKYVKLGMINFM
jgi:hypothetical protein